MTGKFRKTTIVVASLVLLLIVTTAVIVSIWPTQEESFFELGLLGKDKSADSYFSGSNSTVDVGDTNGWFIFVHNHMNQKQNIIVKVKLLNSTMTLPDDKTNQPSNVASFVSFPLSLSLNQTMLVPFYWNVIKAETYNGSINIKSLVVNEQVVNVSVSASVHSSFRIVFELWVQDPVSGEYRFGWQSKDNFSSISLNIGFKLGEATAL